MVELENQFTNRGINMNFKNIFIVVSIVIAIGMTGCDPVNNDTNGSITKSINSNAKNNNNNKPAITPLPTGVTITTPTLTATLVSTKNTTYGVDVDGNIPLSGLLVKVPYHANRDVTLNDFTSSSVVIDSSKTNNNVAVNVRFQWSGVTLAKGDGYFDAKIVPVSSAYHAKQLDLNASGYIAATLLYPTDDNSSTGQLELKVIPGIPDKNFNVLTNGKYEHQFVYMPIKSSTGRVWLNNNLGAAYADLNSPDFNSTQQATAANDYKAYGLSLIHISEPTRRS